VFLHVGSPKTGTSYLQGMVWHHRRALRDRGVLLPGRSERDQYHAALDVRQEYARSAAGERLKGAWGRLVRAADDWDGRVLVTSEWLASASREQAQAAVQAWADTGRDVHIVITARDLARQLPAEWQQRLKHGSNRDFDAFMRKAQRPGNAMYARLWAAQDYADVADRWGRGLAPQRVHLVTVPPSGAPSTLLWERYAQVIEPRLAELGPTGPAANTSLALEQAELLRLLNRQLGDRLSAPGEYTRFVRKMFTNRVLGGRPGTGLHLGGPDLEFARTRSHQVVEALRSSDVDVVGDLDDLLVAEGGAPESSPRQVPTADILLHESLEALAVMIANSAELVREREASGRHAVVVAEPAKKLRRLFRNRRHE
jgi:hypothetical protein